MASDAPIYGLDGLTLGERIKRARKRAGKKQPELAFSAEISPYVLSRWETDRCAPTLYAFAALAEALRIPMEALYWGPLPEKDAVPVADLYGGLRQVIGVVIAGLEHTPAADLGEVQHAIATLTEACALGDARPSSGD